MARHSKIDKRIERAYVRTCSDVQIDVMDIPKVFAAAKEALAAQELNEQELDNVVRNFVNTIRKN